jgi:arsenate reductase (thioredoxin)
VADPGATPGTKRGGRAEHLWLYLVAPTAGTLATVVLARLVRAPEAIESETGAVMTEGKKRVLFVCVENSNRSQMAEAFARVHGGESIEAYSSGSKPAGRVNPRAIEFMKEVGYDLSAHTSKPLTEIPDVEYDAAVTMGCGDNCPLVKAKLRENWGVPDPKELPPEQFREVRDLIERKVKELLSRLE